MLINAYPNNRSKSKMDYVLNSLLVLLSIIFRFTNQGFPLLPGIEKVLIWFASSVFISTVTMILIGEMEEISRINLMSGRPVSITMMLFGIVVWLIPISLTLFVSMFISFASIPVHVLGIIMFWFVGFFTLPSYCWLMRNASRSMGI